MKKNRMLFTILVIFFSVQGLIFAQYAPRQDAIWARTVPAGTITMDGVLNEAAWAQAETIQLNYGQPGLLPTSGWRPEFQEAAITDPTHATVKFLVSDDNKLWLAFDIPDSSIGGNGTWARWDGILMSVKDKSSLDALVTTPAATEYFYTWWIAGFPFEANPIVGGSPVFRGGPKVGNNVDTTRTPEQVAAWDARTVVVGTSNDAGRDTKWVVEMRLDMPTAGYDITNPNGEIVALNFSIWDCDYLFEGNASKINTTRTHIQRAFNDNGENVLSIYAKPDIGLTSTLPDILPDVIIPNGAAFTDPTIDGIPDEAVWAGAYTFNLGWDIETLRQDYPGVGKFMSGHFQAELDKNPRPPVLDPSFAKINIYFKDNYLYLSADINDADVEGAKDLDSKFDGLRLIIGDRVQLNLDNNMIFKKLLVNFNLLGAAAPSEFLTTLIDSGKAEFAVALKGATTVNDKSDVDEGYTIELKVDLTALGYPGDLGDKLFFGGVMLADFDTFDDPLANYGTRTWWFREHDGGPSTPWAVLDPDKPVSVEGDEIVVVPNSIQLLGNYPNPFNPSTIIKFSIPEAGDINISVFNAIGEQIKSENIFGRNAGALNYTFNASAISSGVYFYKVALNNSTSGKNYVSSIGKMILLK